MRKYKKPLKRSISIGCISFILSLCVVLSIVNYSSLRRALFERYNNYLTDIVRFIDYKIDKDDLYKCMQTSTKSENYKMVQQIMNDFLDTGKIHYLYIVTPLEVEPSHTSLSVLNGMTKYEIENEYDDLYFLGDVFDDFPPRTVQNFMNAMKKPGEITFDLDRESSSWGFDYSALLPLSTSDGKVFTVLAADISVSEIFSTLLRHGIVNILLILVVGFIFSIIFILWSKKNVTKPIEDLEHSVVEFAETSHGQNDPSQLVYNKPDIHTSNEVESLSDAVNQMSGDIKLYATSILEAENKISNLRQNASRLGVLAYQDALTHVKNKAAYDKAKENINEAIKNKDVEFALVMIDLNSLKTINDVYGHENGNLYITGSCSIICRIYDHSPVFRIGGDEFLVLLENIDYINREELYQKLTETFRQTAEREECDPWKRYSLAAGMAVFNPEADNDIDSVFNRADKIMYDNKQRMKAKKA